MKYRATIIFTVVILFCGACTPATKSCTVIQNSVESALRAAWNFIPGIGPTAKPRPAAVKDCRQRMMIPDTVVNSGWPRVAGYQQGEMQPVDGGRAGIPDWISKCSTLRPIPLVKFPNVANVQQLGGGQLQVRATLRCAWASYGPSKIPGVAIQGPLCRYWAKPLVYSTAQFNAAYVVATYEFGPPA